MRLSLVFGLLLAHSVFLHIAEQPVHAEDSVVILDQQPENVSALKFVGAESTQVMTASPRDTRTYDATTGREIRTLNGLGGSTAAISQNGSMVAVMGWDWLTLHDAQTGNKLQQFDPYGQWDRKFPFRPRVVAVEFSPDGKLIATGGSRDQVGGSHGLPGGVVTVWEVATGKVVHRFAKLSTSVCSLSFDAAGKHIAAGTNGAGGELPMPGEIVIWDMETGKEVRSFTTKKEVDYGEFSSAADISLSPDGQFVAVAMNAGGRGSPAGLIASGETEGVQIREISTGDVVSSLKPVATPVQRVSFSPDGKRLAVAGGGKVVQLFEVKEGGEVVRLPFEVPMIETIAFSPDGQRLVAASGNPTKPGIVKIWKLSK